MIKSRVCSITVISLADSEEIQPQKFCEKGNMRVIQEY